jgi:hypothetical protein
MPSAIANTIALLKAQNSAIGKATILPSNQGHIIKLEIKTYPHNKTYVISLDELLDRNEATIHKA